MNAGSVVIKASLDTKSFDKQIQQIENELKEIEYQLKQADLGFEVKDVDKLQARYEKLKNTLISLRKQQLMNGVNINQELSTAGKSLEGIVGKVAKWSVALFGVRSAYSFIRKSISTISQYDEQIGADINYMSTALASTLEPVVRRIVDWAHKLMVYVGYIIKAWTGADIFKNANKYLQKAVGNAKQLNKQLASFDEMNILSDNASGGAGTTLPSFDLANPKDVPIPSWLQWIVDHKEEVIGGLAGIAGGLGLINPELKNLKLAGIALILDGIVGSVKAIRDFMKDPTFNNFIKIVIRIGEAVVGVGVAFSSLPVIVAGIVILIVGLIVKNYDKIMGLFNNFISWLDGSFRNKMRELFGPIGDLIVEPILFAVNYAKGLFEGFYGGIKKIVDGIIKIFKGDFKGGIADVFGGLKSIMLAPINALISGINSLIRGINKIKIKAPDWLPLVGGKEFGFNIPQIPKLAKGGIVNLPGRGVNYAGANIGEKKPEGIIPLTDAQQMALLGEAIGKYITINATITNSMNGRVISRELQKIQNENDFAFNR